jgi:hypothetical protein
MDRHAGREPWVLMFAINIFLLIAGFFLPPVAVILMAAPILLPIVTNAGFDPYWFAVVLTINMEIGLITPAGRPEPVCHQRHRAGNFAAHHPCRIAALRGVHGAGDHPALPVPRPCHVAARHADGTSRMSRISYLQDLLSSLFERREGPAPESRRPRPAGPVQSLLSGHRRGLGLQTAARCWKTTLTPTMSRSWRSSRAWPATSTSTPQN